VAVLLARGGARGGIEIGFLPEGCGQTGKAQRDIEILGGAHDVLAGLALEERIEVGAGHQAGPGLRPTVTDPVRRNEARYRLAEALGEPVLGQAV